MKKYIICFIVALVLSNCEIRTKTTHAENTNKTWISVDHYIIDGMDYAAFCNSNGGGISVVNVTRDKLQVEMLTKNINKSSD